MDNGQKTIIVSESEANDYLASERHLKTFRSFFFHPFFLFISLPNLKIENPIYKIPFPLPHVPFSHFFVLCRISKNLSHKKASRTPHAPSRVSTTNPSIKHATDTP
ncbi:hypothetical protein RJT34_24469 [Clitoria ternatea]|uniref:Uncharacterized protein n=1 Tax=Clitoria ternatea TaxID=43366 RepID=A0AAN9FMX7_CLITE